MSQLFYGSLDVTTLLENLKSKHSSFTKGKNGKIYASINVWLNDQKDEFGNTMSVQINPSKEKKDIDKKIYIGNLKQSEGAKPISDKDVDNVQTDYDIPTKAKSETSSESDISTDSDLPF